MKKMGFNVDETESHHGSVNNCTIKGLGDYPEIRKIWLKHMTDIYNDESQWTTGEDYQ